LVNNTNDVEGPAYVRAQLAEELTKRFYTIKPLSEVDQLLRDQLGITLGRQLDMATPRQLCEALGVDGLFYGGLDEFREFNEQLTSTYHVRRVQIRSKMIDCRIGETVWKNGIGIKTVQTIGEPGYFATVGAVAGLASALSEKSKEPKPLLGEAIPAPWYELPAEESSGSSSEASAVGLSESIASHAFKAALKTPLHAETKAAVTTVLNGFITKPGWLVPSKVPFGTAIPSGPGVTGKPSFSIVRIFYATDRKRTGDQDPAALYGNDRGILELGTCEISIPKDHRIAHLESPSILKLEFREDPRNHVVLLNVSPQPTAEFFSQLNDRVGRSKRKEAFVFIHGYNVTFEDAARRTAQIAYDLEFDGAPILYSWPSQGELAKYMVDETNIDWTVTHLNGFLHEIAQKSQASVIHLIAHSMGSRALMRTLQQVAARPRDAESVPKFRQVVLTAPDMDAEVFRDLAREVRTAVERITLYASSQDKALVESKRFHGYPRAGDSGGLIVIVPEADTVDVSAVDTSLLGHSYYGDNRSVLSDLFNLIKQGKPPHERFGLRPREHNGATYWAFQP
jgi:esterase/lipase superfamily enzyme